MIDLLHCESYTRGNIRQETILPRPYEHSYIIENRFKETLALIANNHINAGQLSSKLNVSIPTINRIITELKRRGYPIYSVNKNGKWGYEIRNNTKLNTPTKLRGT